MKWSQELNLPNEKVSSIDINQVPICPAYNILEYGTVINQTETSWLYKEQNIIYNNYEFQMLENA